MALLLEPATRYRGACVARELAGRIAESAPDLLLVDPDMVADQDRRRDETWLETLLGGPERQRVPVYAFTREGSAGLLGGTHRAFDGEICRSFDSAMVRSIRAALVP